MKMIAFSSKEQYAFVKTNNGSLYLTLLVKNALENLNTEITRMTESIFQLVRCSRVGYAPFNFFYVYIAFELGKIQLGFLVFELCSRVKEWYVSVELFSSIQI